MSLYPFSTINDTDVRGIDIVIDTREKKGVQTFRNQLKLMCGQFKIPYLERELPFGDVIINRGHGIILERKTVPDFIGSMTHKNKESKEPRLIEQMTVIRNFICDYTKETIEDSENEIDIPKGYLLLEGGLNVRAQTKITMNPSKKTRSKYFTHTFKYTIDHPSKRTSWKSGRVHLNAYTGFLRKIQRLTDILFTGGSWHSVDYICMLHEKMCKYEKDGFLTSKLQSIRTVKQNLSSEDRLLGILQGFEDIGPVSAHQILTRYRTLRRFFTDASYEELIEIGVTRPAAEKMMQLLDYSFQK